MKLCPADGQSGHARPGQKTGRDSSFTGAVIQMRSGRERDANLAQAGGLIEAAAAQGANYIQTPEMTHLLDRDRGVMLAGARSEDEEPALKAFARLAAKWHVYLHIGSMAIKAQPGLLANRAFIFSPQGRIIARYDKLHMFDVDLGEGERWTESELYRPGNRVTIVHLPWLVLGPGICYDLRFPALFRRQALAGAGLLSAPAAFTQRTGALHWHVLQRTRAIENGAYMASAAQGGRHEDGRQTYGHALIVAPDGAVIAQCEGHEPGFALARIDPARIARARLAIPSLTHARPARLQRFGTPRRDAQKTRQDI